MTVTRIQATKVVTQTFPNTTLTSFDIPRPQTTTPAQVPYAEGSDHVVEPPARDDFSAGHCTVELPATLKLANVYCRTVEIRKALPPAQTGNVTAAALFPNGAPAASGHVRFIVNETTDVLPTASDAFLDLMGEPHATVSTTVRSFPGITLREGEFIRMSLYNNSGGALTDQVITANYKFGLNQQDTGRP